MRQQEQAPDTSRAPSLGGRAMPTVREITVALLRELGMTTVFGNPVPPSCRCSGIFPRISAM
jgi:hypothetical protein